MVENRTIFMLKSEVFNSGTLISWTLPLELLAWSATKIGTCSFQRSILVPSVASPSDLVPGTGKILEASPPSAEGLLEVETPGALSTLRWPKPGGEMGHQHLGHQENLMETDHEFIVVTIWGGGCHYSCGSFTIFQRLVVTV